VKEDIVDAIVSKKPIVLDSWIEVNYHLPKKLQLLGNDELNQLINILT